ncbi:Uncharacterised protein [Burkholderia pseudomallei]|nr:Uncharacterised protein [Burkholderia pseudomallei]
MRRSARAAGQRVARRGRARGFGFARIRAPARRVAAGRTRCGRRLASPHRLRPGLRPGLKSGLKFRLRLEPRAPMAQHIGGDALDVRRGDARRPVERRERPRGAQHHEVAAQAVDGRADAQLGDARVRGVVERERRQRGARRANLRDERRLRVAVLRAKAVRIEIEREPRLDDPLPRRRVVAVRELHHQPETVEQLRAQLALFRVHRADEREARRVAVRHAVALDRVDAARGRVEQRVDERVRQQVDLVDVQHAEMRARDEAGRKAHRIVGERAREVERTRHLLVAGRQRQRDEAPLGQQLGERARGGRFRGAARAAHEHAAQARIDGDEQQRLLQRRLADQRGKRIGGRQCAVVGGGGRCRAGFVRWVQFSSRGDGGCIGCACRARQSARGIRAYRVMIDAGTARATRARSLGGARPACVGPAAPPARPRSIASRSPAAAAPVRCDAAPASGGCEPRRA